MAGEDLKARIEEVRRRADIASVVGGAVKLRGRGNPRGKCPFHGSKSDSLAVYPSSGKVRCWGCGWHGDAIGFVKDFYGLSFVDALVRLEQDLGLRNGLEGQPAGRHGAGGDISPRGTGNPLRTEKRPLQRREVETVDSAVVADWLWRNSHPDHDAVRTWLRARRVPDAMLADHWLGQVRFCPAAPIAAWPEGKGPKDVPQAPAMVALIRRIEEGEGGRRLVPIGVHATYLSPGLRAKMNRKRANGDTVPARKMFGQSAGGMVVLGRYRREAALFVGEGIETVLSGMGLLGAGEDACGLAVLALANLQGHPKLWKSGVWPLFDIEPDPARPGLAFAHDGPVTGLIDADMSPLRGPLVRNPAAGMAASADISAAGGHSAEGGRQYAGMPVVEWRGGPIVRRAITTRERTMICATLFTKAWRAAGCRRATAVAPHAGMDFNDLAREVAT